jgi:eukaryotic-like serine/threonine-protein kinase
LPAVRYKAFISYSHQDEAWARWLQKSLESYRVPRHLVGTRGERGSIPARVAPVFRDREDLSSAADLTHSVRAALEQSDSLIVICSPAALRSPWVNEEIHYFRSIGKADRVFALIVDGDPGDPASEDFCFPPPLLADQDGNRREPLAADPRKWADGRLLARLKLIAGILGIRLDDLRRRDMQRRHRVMMVSMAGLLTIAVVMTVLAIAAVSARNAADNRREHAEELVGYMVGDLKEKLDEVGRLDILEGVGGRVSEYLQTLDQGEVTDESLLQQARVWRQLGEVSKDQGKLDEALAAFRASREVLYELQRRDPQRTEYAYEVGNAEFWVGVVHLNQGDFDIAWEPFEAYLTQADELHRMEPGNPKWMMEQSYAHMNIAALVTRSGGGDMRAATAHIQTAVDLNRRVIELDPDNDAYWSEYSNNLAWLADIHLRVCDLESALKSRREQVDIARTQMTRAPANVNYRRRYAYALTGMAEAAERVGMVRLAEDSYLQARDILAELARVEPGNIDFRFEYLMREVRSSALRAESGELDGAIEQMGSLYEPLYGVLREESFANHRHRLHGISYLLIFSEMSERAGQSERARQLLERAEAELDSLLDEQTDQGSFTEELLTARFLHWQQHGQDLFQSEPFNQIESPPSTPNAGCDFQATLAREALMMGDSGTAETIVERLLERGYRKPAFVRFCREYALCP